MDKGPIRHGEGEYSGVTVQLLEGDVVAVKFYESQYVEVPIGLLEEVIDDYRVLRRKR